VPPETAAAILRLINAEQPLGARFALDEVSPTKFVTAVIAEVMRRVGHKKWADSVKRFWSNRCCATGFDVKKLLRASHIIPWSEDEETRLDFCNGLCLSPAYDAAFDAHLISFQDDGSILLASDFTEESARQIGIDPASRIEGLSPKHRKYLKQHRARCAGEA
jgi:predicted restriction endonuclease